MIRAFKQNDLDQVMHLWLETNLNAHDFIEPSYWMNNEEKVRGMFPEAELYVWDEDGELLGFIGVIEGFIGGLFVDTTKQRNGMGTKLMAYIKTLYDTITLCVYEKNKQAMSFYEKQGFVVAEKKKGTPNDEIEWMMVWQKKMDV